MNTEAQNNLHIGVVKINEKSMQNSSCICDFIKITFSTHGENIFTDQIHKKNERLYRLF